MNFQDNKLYACGEEGGEVAGRVRWNPSVRTIDWFMPGGRQRAYEVAELLEDTPERFVFVDGAGRRFELVELTPSHYNATIRQPGQPHLMTQAQLLAAFELSQG